MTAIYIYTLSGVLIVSLLSFIGALSLALKPAILKKITLYLVSFSAGTLLGGGFLHLLPEALKKHGGEESVWLSLLGGILLFFVLEKIVCWRHCHIPTSSEHPHELGAMNLLGDSLHNFLDGITIAGAFLVNPSLGLATVIAVIAHEIPQEIGDFGVLLHAGFSRGRALLLNFLTALTAVAGALITLIIGSHTEAITDAIVPLAAGGFIYIAAADLIPELKKDINPVKSLIQFAVIVAGIGLMWAMKFLAE